jgi:hypothetical protein
VLHEILTALDLPASAVRANERFATPRRHNQLAAAAAPEASRGFVGGVRTESTAGVVALAGFGTETEHFYGMAVDEGSDIA